LLFRILHEVSERRLIHDEKFAFRPKHSTALHLTRSVAFSDTSTRRGAGFLDVAKAFDAVWGDIHLYRLTILNFPSYLVITISSYLSS
jgi:hypothetical protein